MRTNIPAHLQQMLQILVLEEQDMIAEFGNASNQTGQHSYFFCKKIYTPARIKGWAKNRTGDQFWSRTGRGRPTGDNFLAFFTAKHWENRGKFPEKTGRATKNCCRWTGETEISPVLLYGQGCK